MAILSSILNSLSLVSWFLTAFRNYNYQQVVSSHVIPKVIWILHICVLFFSATSEHMHFVVFIIWYWIRKKNGRSPNLWPEFQSTVLHYRVTHKIK